MLKCVCQESSMTFAAGKQVITQTQIIYKVGVVHFMDVTWTVRDLQGVIISKKETIASRPKICSYLDKALCDEADSNLFSLDKPTTLNVINKKINNMKAKIITIVDDKKKSSMQK